MKPAVRAVARPALMPQNFSLLVLAVMIAALLPSFLRAQTNPGSFADLAERLSPAVVNITTTTLVATPPNGGGPVLPEGSPFEDFFRDFQNRNNNNQAPRRASSLGSGFVISADGYIVTNNHVIEQADEILIEFFSGEELSAEVVGTDPRTDVALLKVDPEAPLPFVSFGDSDTARVGDWVLAIGNPLGQGFSVSAGIVSARARQLQGSLDDFIQTDAAINRGNSGGPLFNTDGEVIGVNTAILSPNGGSIGIGFSMSSKVVSGVVEQLRDFGETRRGWLGVRIQPVDDGVAEALGLDEARGALIADVPAGPASEAGILPGDVILTFDGRDVAEMRDLPRMVAETSVGKVVDVTVFRDGELRTLSVLLGRLEDAQLASAQPRRELPELERRVTVVGMTLSGLSEAMREEYSLPDGARGVVVVSVDPMSEAAEKGIREGDLIEEIGQRSVSTAAEAETQISNAAEAGRTSLLILLRSNGTPRFAAIDPNG